MFPHGKYSRSYLICALCCLTTIQWFDFKAARSSSSSSTFPVTALPTPCLPHNANLGRRDILRGELAGRHLIFSLPSDSSLHFFFLAGGEQFESESNLLKPLTDFIVGAEWNKYISSRSFNHETALLHACYIQFSTLCPKRKDFFKKNTRFQGRIDGWGKC